MNDAPILLAFVADGKQLSIHGYVEAACCSVVCLTELSGLLKQQGATAPQIVHTLRADSQDQLVPYAFCFANMALKRKESQWEVSATRAAEPDFVEAKILEPESWKRSNVYELAPDRGETIATTRWVNTS